MSTALLERQTRGLGFTPRTVDDDNRTVELIASTGAGVPRVDMEGPFLEMLSVARGAVDLSRVDGMPLLDTHDRGSLDGVLGVARAARVEDGKLIVTVQISERAEAIWKDIKAGIIRNVSVGYAVDDFDDRVDRATGQRVRTVTKWTLHEISLVPVAADSGAKTRGQPAMTDNTAPPATPLAPATNTPPPAVTRAAVNQEIRALATTFDLGPDFSDELIDREATIEEARGAALDKMRKTATKPGPQARVTVIADHTDPATIVTRMGEALYVRGNPAHKLSEAARPYVNMTTLDMARQCLQVRGLHTTGLSPAETITRALHTTSDFPLIFADTANRSLRTAYDAAPAVLKQVARQTTAKDFRAKTAIQLGEAPTLEKVNEHGEYKYGSMAEAAESYKIDTFGKIFGYTRKMIVNDDIGALLNTTSKFALAVADFEAQFLVDLLQKSSGDGPTMSDTKALFDSDHGNVTSSEITGDNIQQQLESFGTAVAAARLAMRKQVGLSGRPINIPPKFLLVPPELETLGELLVTSVQPNRAADANPLGASLTLLTEARLSSPIRWYVASDPAVIDGLEFAYLQGSEGPQVTTRAGFEVDGVEIKVSLDFGAAFLDWRSWYKNDGESVTA